MAPQPTRAPARALLRNAIMSAVIQRQMNVSGRSRGAAVNSPDGQTGEAAAELWERLRGLSAVILLRAWGERACV